MKQFLTDLKKIQASVSRQQISWSKTTDPDFAPNRSAFATFYNEFEWNLSVLEKCTNTEQPLQPKLKTMISFWRAETDSVDLVFGGRTAIALRSICTSFVKNLEYLSQVAAQ